MILRRLEKAASSSAAPASGLAAFWLALALATAACGPALPPAAAEEQASPVVALGTAESEVVALAEAQVPPTSAQPRVPKPPAGYVVMTVGGVVVSRHGKAVVLVSEAGDLVLPIFVGGTEALAIELRRKQERYPRPLTHDLLDQIMLKLGGELVKVQVDAIRGDTFVGSVFVRRDDRIYEVDARPSDAICLALGNRVPIFVAGAVLARAGIRRKEMADPSLGGPNQI